MVRELGEHTDLDNIRACSFPNPGFKAEEIRPRLKNIISAKDDVVFILGGTNNVSEHSTDKCIREVGKLIKEAEKLRPNSPTLVSEIPPRYDIVEHRKIRKINDYIRQACQNSKNLILVSNAYERADFDKGGLHLSNKGKQKLATSIRNTVKTVCINH